MKRFEEVRAKARSFKGKKIAVCNAANEEVMNALEMARKDEIAEAILVGKKADILDVMKKLEIPENTYEIIDAADDLDSAAKSVQLVRGGRADILMKGLVDTGVILKAVLDRDHGLRKSKVLSHVALFETPFYHKMLTVTDAAMNIAPDVDQKEAIIKNALMVTRSLGIEKAKVAVLAANEKVKEKMQATLDAKELVDRQIEGAIVAGPLALDNAVSKESARIKGITSEVGGDADVLLAPQIESGNILYKSLGFLSQSEHAGIIVGAACPIVLTSRADEEQSKLNSIALALITGESMKE